MPKSISGLDPMLASEVLETSVLAIENSGDPESYRIETAQLRFAIMAGMVENIVAHGAVNGGDSGAALQAAVTAAGTSGLPVYIPPGTYQSNQTITLPTNATKIEIVGAGRGVSVLDFSGLINAPALDVSDSVWTVLRNFKMVGDSSSGHAIHGVDPDWMSGTYLPQHLQIEKVWITGFTGQQTMLGSAFGGVSPGDDKILPACGIFVAGGLEVHILDCTLSANDVGAYLYSVGQPKIERSVFDGNPSAGIVDLYNESPAYNANDILTASTVIGATVPLMANSPRRNATTIDSAGLVTVGSHGCTISKNKFKGCRVDIVTESDYAPVISENWIRSDVKTGILSYGPHRVEKNTFFPAFIAPKTFTTNFAVNDKLTSTSHGFLDGEEVILYNAGGALPGGLFVNTPFFVKTVNPNDFELALTPGGATVDITSDGTGTHTVAVCRREVWSNLPSATMCNIGTVSHNIFTYGGGGGTHAHIHCTTPGPSNPLDGLIDGNYFGQPYAVANATRVNFCVVASGAARNLTIRDNVHHVPTGVTISVRYSTPDNAKQPGPLFENNVNQVDGGTIQFADLLPANKIYRLNSQGRVVDVTYYGADATGATDSVSALANAINSLATGDELHFPPGVFTSSSNLSIPSGVRITGPGELKAIGATTICLVLADDCTVEGLHVNGNAIANYGIYIGDGVSGCRVHKCKVGNVAGTTAVAIGVEGDGADYTVIEDNDIYDVVGSSVGRGIRLSGNTTPGTPVRGVKIVKNRIDNVQPVADGDGIVVQDWTAMVDVLIHGNTMTNCAKRGIKLSSPGCIVSNNHVVIPGTTAYSAIDAQIGYTQITGNTIEGAADAIISMGSSLGAQGNICSGNIIRIPSGHGAASVDAIVCEGTAIGDVLISDNVVTAGSAIRSFVSFEGDGSGAKVTDNTFSGPVSGGSAAIYTGYNSPASVMHDVVISDNRFAGVTGEYLLSDMAQSSTGIVWDYNVTDGAELGLTNSATIEVEVVSKSLKDFGGKGDGSTNNATAFADAIAAMPDSGWTLVIPPGTYVIDKPSGQVCIDIQNKSNFRIIGHGATIKAADTLPVAAGNAILYLNNCEDFSIDGLKVDGNRANRTPSEVFAHSVVLQECRRFTLKKVTSNNAVVDGFILTPTTSHDVSTYCRDGSFIDCHADNCYRQGISVIGGFNLRFEGGSLTNTNGTAPQAGIDLEADVETIAPDFSVSTTFTTNSAVDDKLDATAHPFENGDRVYVKSTGTLPGGLTANTQYYVVNRTANDLELSTTLGGSAVDITSDGSPTHSIALALPTMKNILIKGVYVAGNTGPGVQVSNQQIENAVIENCEITDCDSCGVLAAGNCTIRNNDIHDFTSVASSGVIDVTSAGHNRGVLIEGNNFYNISAAKPCIYTASTSQGGTRVIGNHARKVYNFGVFYARDMFVSGNIVKVDQALASIYNIGATGDDGLYIGNTFEGFQGSAIYQEGLRNRYIQNNFLNAVSTGIVAAIRVENGSAYCDGNRFVNDSSISMPAIRGSASGAAEISDSVVLNYTTDFVALNGGSIVVHHTGTGSPEGALSGSVGSTFVRKDGGDNTTLYRKESAPTASTGWEGVGSGGSGGSGDGTFTTLTPDDTTPDVTGLRLVKTANTVPTAYAGGFVGGVEGQLLVIYVNDANTSFTENSSQALMGGASIPASSSAFIVALRYDGTQWVEEWYSSRAHQFATSADGSSNLTIKNTATDADIIIETTGTGVVNIVADDLQLNGTPVGGGGGLPAGGSVGDLVVNTGSGTGAWSSVLSVGANRATVTGGTVTSSTPVLTLTQTFNSGAVTFDAIDLNVTNSASAAGSRVLNLRVGGNSVYNVTAAGAVRGVNGLASSPTYSFINDTDTGMYFATNTLNFSVNGAARLSITETAATSTGQFITPFGSGGGLIFGSALAGVKYDSGSQQLEFYENGISGGGALQMTVGRASVQAFSPLFYKHYLVASTAGVGSPNIITAAFTNTVFTNEGSTAKNYHTLPAAAAGIRLQFVVQDADGMRITAASGDTIRLGNKVTAAAGYIESTTIGDTVTLVAINATEWVAVSAIGTWTDGTFTFTLVSST